jgi:hypothetical protein
MFVFVDQPYKYNNKPIARNKNIKEPSQFIVRALLLFDF